jgi:hypothetical protein
MPRERLRILPATGSKHEMTVFMDKDGTSGGSGQVGNDLEVVVKGGVSFHRTDFFSLQELSFYFPEEDRFLVHYYLGAQGVGAAYRSGRYCSCGCFFRLTAEAPGFASRRRSTCPGCTV